MQFRQQALAKLQSPEELDLPRALRAPPGLARTERHGDRHGRRVRVGRHRLGALHGRRPAILTHGEGSYILQSPVAGQVTAVLAKEGQRLPADAPVLQVRTNEGDAVVRTVAAGRITGLAATIGQIIQTGTNVAAVEKVAHASDPLYATVYVPAETAASIPADASVDLTVQSVPAQSYGVLRGHVRSVDRTAQSAQQIAAFLGDSQLGEQFTRKGRPVAVLVRLDPSSRTKSGYKWSSAEGPPFTLSSMTLATGSIRLADQRPVDWLLP